jgi:hypothetical protein
VTPFRGVMAGAVGLGLPILLQVALGPMLGDGWTFAAFAPALVVGFGVAVVYAEFSTLRLTLGALLMLLVPLASLALPEARMLGPIATATVADAPARRLAAGFDLPGAAPAEAQARTVTALTTSRPADLRGRRGAPITTRGTYLVAPVAGPGWTPAQPVQVVVVQDLDDTPARPWAPAGGVLKLLPDANRAAAVRLALAESGLAAAPDLVIGRWVPSPGWARLEAAQPLLLLYGGALVAWAGLLAAGRRGGVRRSRPGREPRRSR